MTPYTSESGAIVGKQWRINPKQIEERTDHYLLATYKGYDIEIEEEIDNQFACRTFYIMVTGVDSGSRLYDGYAPGGVYTMEEAVEEALKGAMLIGENNG